MEWDCTIGLFLTVVMIVEQGMGDDGLESVLTGNAATGRQLVVENCGTVLVFGFTARRLIRPSSRLGDFLDNEV